MWQRERQNKEKEKLWAQWQDYLWTRMTRSSVGVWSAGTASAPKSSLKKNSQNKTEGSLITTSKSIAYEYRGNWSENKKAVISCIYNHNGQLIPSFTDIFPCWSQTVYTKAIVVELKQIPEHLPHPPLCLWQFHDLGKFLLKASQWWFKFCIFSLQKSNYRDVGFGLQSSLRGSGRKRPGEDCQSPTRHQYFS